MPKTGSSSIQKFLKINRENLLNFGILYPENIDLHNLTFYPLFLEKPFDYIDLKKFYKSEQEAIEKNKEYKELWLSVFRADNYNDLIISSENLYFSSEKEVKKIYNFTKGYFDEIKIICYIRDPKSFLVSWIQQGIKGGMIHENNMNNIVYKTASMAKYSLHLNNWIEYFGINSIKIINFDKNFLYRNDIVRDFFFHLGYIGFADNLNGIVQENISLNSSLISFLYNFNQKYPAFKDGMVNYERGLLMNKDYFAKILRRVETDKKRNSIIISDSLKDEFNKEIIFINSYLSDETKIDLLKLDGIEINEYIIEEVDLELSIDIVNECFKEIENLVHNNSEYTNKNKIITNLHDKKASTLIKEKQSNLFDQYETTIQNLKADLDRSKQEVIYYSQSNSWRLTRPLRKIKKLIKCIFNP